MNNSVTARSILQLIIGLCSRQVIGSSGHITLQDNFGMLGLHRILLEVWTRYLQTIDIVILSIDVVECITSGNKTNQDRCAESGICNRVCKYIDHYTRVSDVPRARDVIIRLVTAVKALALNCIQNMVHMGRLSCCSYLLASFQRYVKHPEVLVPVCSAMITLTACEMNRLKLKQDNTVATLASASTRHQSDREVCRLCRELTEILSVQ
jgi:hypothetical protein